MPAANAYVLSARKRAFDLIVAGAVSLVAAPLVALCALAVRLESAGSPIYRQWRVGRDEHPFEIVKLRTMTVDAEKHRGT